MWVCRGCREPRRAGTRVGARLLLAWPAIGSTYTRCRLRTFWYYSRRAKRSFSTPQIRSRSSRNPFINSSNSQVFNRWDIYSNQLRERERVGEERVLRACQTQRRIHERVVLWDRHYLEEKKVRRRSRKSYATYHIAPVNRSCPGLRQIVSAIYLQTLAPDYRPQTTASKSGPSQTTAGFCDKPRDSKG